MNNINVKDWLGENNKIGQDIWESKYRYNGESFDEWIDRVSAGNANVKSLIKDKKFLFGGRILANRGLEHEGRKISLSNCYVITPPNDDIESIFECAKKLARTYSYGGGCGTDISNLAPRGAKIHNAAKTTTGAVSFMDLYSMVTGLIGQEGRRGALMLSMSCDHPDIEEFINVKNNLDKITYANISVRITDGFMKAVKDNSDFTLYYKRETTGEVITKTVKARYLFKEFCKNNWNNAEPGMLFWDRIKHWNLLSNTKEFEFAATNPCAEEPLPAGGSCLLGSINLSAYVINKNFDFNAFEQDVKIAVDALNEVLDEGIPLHPLEEQRESVAKWRQIGLGIMGLADMLVKMEVEYGSKASIDICTKIARAMSNSALSASSNLAKKYGAYPAFHLEDVIGTEYLNFVADPTTIELIKENGLRNSQLLTIAPTGTLSTMLGISGGLEPIFANYYTRTTKSLHNEDVDYKVYTPIVKQYMESNNISNDADLPHWFITSSDIDYNNRILMQAAWQKYIDASISSTVNLPEDTTEEDVENLYLSAWENGVKGITIFRNNCNRTAILNTEKPKVEEKITYDDLPRGTIIEADDNVVGLKRKLTTGCGSLHCTAFFDPASGDLLETYFNKGSTGGCNQFMIGLSRTISLLARSGVDIDSIIDQLNSCGTCPSYAVRTATKHDTSKGACCPAAIGVALKDMYEEMQSRLTDKDEFTTTNTPSNPDTPKEESGNSNVMTHVCPQCGEKTLIYEGGCRSCKTCGYSKCE